MLPTGPCLNPSPSWQSQPWLRCVSDGRLLVSFIKRPPIAAIATASYSSAGEGTLSKIFVYSFPSIPSTLSRWPLDSNLALSRLPGRFFLLPWILSTEVVLKEDLTGVTPEAACCSPFPSLFQIRRQAACFLQAKGPWLSSACFSRNM